MASHFAKNAADQSNADILMRYGDTTPQSRIAKPLAHIAPKKLMASTAHLSAQQGLQATSANQGVDTQVQSAFYCDNTECSVGKLVKMEFKSKGPQFITEPTIRGNPSFVTGFTTVFQVDGKAARLGDLKLPTGLEQAPNTIYRVVPGTHAHIINYVVVESDRDSLRKINDKDPATMQKLLESQRASANEMLKLIVKEGQGVPSTATVITTGRTATVPNVNPKSTPSQSPNFGSTSGISPSALVTLPTQPTPVQLAHPRHPNLKITAVASADTVASVYNPVNTLIAPTSVQVPMPMPILQSAPSVLVNTMPQNVLPSLTPAPSIASVEFDRMNVEIQELRLTVARLAEAQAKKQQDKEAQARGVKRSLQK